MELLPRKLVSALRGPVPISRDRAISWSERISAGTSLVSSLEYLANRSGIQEGGLNDWNIMRGANARSSPPIRFALELVANKKATTALHVARVAASVGLIAPVTGRWRGVANVFLGVSNSLLYPRHRLGTDGSDQVSTMVQTVVGLARVTRTSQVRDALMWYVALQANLSYLVSGWVKLLGEPWRSGSALSGIMRTRTYGHKRFWELTRRFPTLSRGLTHATLLLECLFPIAYLKSGALARPVILAAASFHVANGFLMGLGRFVTSFVAMHPMVLYTSSPRKYPTVAGRDDRALHALGLVVAGAAVAAAALATARRLRTVDTSPSTRTAFTRHGNELSYDSRIRTDRSTPVVVFSPALIASPEHFGWIIDTILRESSYDVLLYSRAGYGPSKYNGKHDFTLQESVDDLIDLVAHAIPEGRDVVLVGHSLGGELARRAAAAHSDRVCGVVYLDSSHPAELQRSEQQSESAKNLVEGIRQFIVSLQLGMGALLDRPDWVDNLPAAYRKQVFTQYADSRLWKAGLREWRATEREFRNYVDEVLPMIDTHALVVSARRTIDRDREQKVMYDELAGAHRSRDRVVKSLVIDGADHDSLLTNARHATEVARELLAFLDEISEDKSEGSGLVEEVR